MYENTQKPKKYQNNKLVYIFLAICVVFGVITVFLVAGVIRQDQQFKRFIADLSASTSYAYSEGKATAVMNGKERMLSGEDVHEIYALLANSRGRKPRQRPDTQPEVEINYGDGSVLAFWSTELENSGNNRTVGLLVYYCGADGWSCCYDTDRLDLEQVKLLLRKKLDFVIAP